MVEGIEGLAEGFPESIELSSIRPGLTWSDVGFRKSRRCLLSHRQDESGLSDLPAYVQCSVESEGV